MHEGHRKRKKEWVMEHGFDELHAHELLEFMLYYAVPRADTNETAHRLLDTFGTLKAVIEAPVEELADIKGVGKSVAWYLKMFSAVSRAVCIEEAGKDISLKNFDSFIKYVFSLFHGKTGENFYCMCFSRSQKLVYTKLIASGYVDGVNVPIDLIIKTALAQNARSVVFAHNHPFGMMRFSDEDCVFTENALDALGCAGIKLIDHFLISGDSYISFYGGVV